MVQHIALSSQPAILAMAKKPRVVPHTNPLLAPYKMGEFELQHRLAYAPLTRCRAIETVPQPAAIEYYRQRTTKGGLMISEATNILQGSHGYPHTPGIYTEEQIEAWKPIVKAVHDAGGVFFLQLWHCGRASHPDYQLDGSPPVAPSAIAIGPSWEVYTQKAPYGPYKYPVPRALETEEIPGIVQAYATAARNAIAAGFDGVEIHGANGYLIDEFIKADSNKRTDRYGGGIENRARFALEVTEAVVEAVGAGRTGIRLSPFNTFLDATDPDPVPLNVYLAQKLSDMGLVYVHYVEPRVTGGGQLVENVPDNHHLGHFREVFKGTFIAAGGFNRENGIKAVEAGETDLVAYGRLFLANPDLPERYALPDAPLNKYDRATFYTQDQKVGYTDYPFLEEVAPEKAKEVAALLAV